MINSDDSADDWAACEEAIENGQSGAQDHNGKLALLKKLHRLRDFTALPITDEPNKLGRFILRREIGRGTFGVVYLAFDPELDREVALKVPHAEVLITPELRQRFRQEAQAAAALDHPNVVTVHEVGEFGVMCYLVSTYCPGGNLADWLRQQRDPIPVQTAADLIRTIAGAVQHAHDHGIVHRDLKPANVLLQSSSADSADENSIAGNSASAQSAVKLLPRITDFGLAKLVDGDGSGTRTGAIVGTPLYMAPEQATPGQHAVGPGADVYALGAMLYELLTGRPPFTGENTLDILYQVRHHDPVPIRRLRPRVPRDLETVCLHCLEKSPTERYDSAAELGDDLERFLNGFPVQARPIGPLGKTWRWAQRRPAVVVLLVGLFLSLLGGSIGVLTQWQRAAKHSEETQQEQDRANQQQERANINARRARDMATQLATLADEIADQPGFDKSRQRLLDDALVHFEQFLAESGDDPTMRLETARAACRAGQLRQYLGQSEPALQAFRRAGQLIDSLLAENPQDDELLLARAECHYGESCVAKLMRNSPETIKVSKVAVALVKPLTQHPPIADKARQLWVDSLLNLADGQHLGFFFDYAEDTLADVDRIYAQYPLTEKSTPAWQRTRALSEETRMGNCWKRQKITEAEAAVQKALAIHRALHEARPTIATHQFDMARNHASLSGVCRVRRDFAGAAKACEDAIRLEERLIADHAGVPLYRVHFISDLGSLGGHYSNLRQRPQAVQAYRRAFEAQQKMIDDFPNDPLNQNSATGLIVRRINLADALRINGEYDEAAKFYRQALVAPVLESARCGLALILALHPDPSKRQPAEAITLAEAALKAAPSHSEYLMALGAARLSAGDAQGALTPLESAVKGRYPRDASGFLLAMALARAGQLNKARATLQQAESKLGQFFSSEPELRRIAAEAKAVVSESGL